MSTIDILIYHVERISTQLDERVPAELFGLPDLILRAVKVQEEAGELATAVIGVLGQNPRKGFTHTTDDVINEAIDVALSAFVFAESAAEPGTLSGILRDRLAYLEERAATFGAPAATVTRLHQHAPGTGGRHE